MYKAICLFLFAFLSASPSLHAQDEKEWLRQQVDTLCSKHMAGRGYVDSGREKAALYIENKFEEYKLQLLNIDNRYVQAYRFPVNTFPGQVTLQLNKKKLSPGVDFLVDAGDASYHKNRARIKKVDLANIKDTAAWRLAKASFTLNKTYYLKNADSLCKHLSIKIWRLAEELPAGCFLIPQHGKLTWTVSSRQLQAAVFYVEDTILPRKIRKANANVDAVLIPYCRSDNITGIIPGQVEDSFIVFSAHYDHLGMMGKGTMFPGASDNASGTAMLLYLAQYFAKHPQHYSIAFIAFSGEEAGLKGSEYFVEHPLIPLDHIRFLTNLDIMGDATDGVTVVNATEYPKQFEMLQKINTQNNYLPAIKSRGKAANSDHYHFSEAGVPAFFIYSNGGKGYYHDVFDKADALTLNNIDQVAKMLIEFGKELNK